MTLFTTTRKLTQFLNCTLPLIVGLNLSEPFLPLHFISAPTQILPFCSRYVFNIVCVIKIGTDPGASWVAE